MWCLTVLLVCFGGISDKFGQAMVSILERCRQGKVPKARLFKPDVPSRSKHYLKTYDQAFIMAIPKFDLMISCPHQVSDLNMFEERV